MTDTAPVPSVPSVLESVPESESVESTTETTSTAESTTTTTTEPATESVEQVLNRLNRLQRTYMEHANLANTIKGQLMKIQDQLLAAQDATHRSYQNLTNAKEQYLVSVITHQRGALSQCASAKEEPPAMPDVPEIVESRDDNVAL